jgi:hypothetical protein
MTTDERHPCLYQTGTLLYLPHLLRSSNSEECPLLLNLIPHKNSQVLEISSLLRYDAVLVYGYEMVGWDFYLHLYRSFAFISTTVTTLYNSQFTNCYDDVKVCRHNAVCEWHWGGNKDTVFFLILLSQNSLGKDPVLEADNPSACQEIYTSSWRPTFH